MDQLFEFGWVGALDHGFLADSTVWGFARYGRLQVFGIDLSATARLDDDPESGFPPTFGAPCQPPTGRCAGGFAVPAGRWLGRFLISIERETSRKSGIKFFGTGLEPEIY